jgi:hypothetical protein
MIQNCCPRRFTLILLFGAQQQHSPSNTEVRLSPPRFNKSDEDSSTKQMFGCTIAPYNVDMSSLKDTSSLKSTTAEEDHDERVMESGSAYSHPTWELTQLDKKVDQQFGCTSCTYYDPKRTYCTYIHTPIEILFACPKDLKDRRTPRQ